MFRMSTTPKTVPDRLSHYRLLEQIGAGGMGVVYLARDEQLQRNVALKVLPPGSLADEIARKRFRKEALSLAKLNHPNIATVHEFGTDANTDFLVTEYIAGTTLNKKLKDGPMPFDEVYKLGIQLGQGLTAAHCQGVIHRDLKPANLRLTPDGRLKILDFGLAQLMPQPNELSSSARTATSISPLSTTPSPVLTGTLPYMAPEQMRGEKPDPRSDIWSAGAVLYELATGKRAFPQTNASILINAILSDAPVPPSSVNKSVPPALERIVLRALAKDPTQRYQNAEELTADLRSRNAAVAAGEARQGTRWLVLGIAAGLAIAIAAFLLVRMKKPPIAVAPSAPHRRAVAVLGFKNLTGNTENAWLSTALSEMLTTELGEGNQLRTIPGESVANMKISLALPDEDSFSMGTLHRIAQNLGSDDVVVGSFLPIGNGQLRVDLRLQDTASGETLATVSEKGSKEQIDDLVGKAGDDLREKLGVAPLSGAQSASARASLPANPEAARLYSEGLRALSLFDAQSARNLFERATKIEPDHAPTHSALAAALSSLGYDDQAKEEARKALDLSAQSPREVRLQIEGRSHKLLSQWPEAIDDYRALFEFFPDQVDYGISLIGGQIMAGRVNDAEATLAQLRKLKVSDADAARIDLWDAEVGASEGDMKREQTLSDKAVNEGKEIGAKLLVAQALLIEGEASNRLGQPERAKTVIDQSKDLYTVAGDQRGVGRALLYEGDIQFDQGKFHEARADFDQGLAAFEKIGARRSIRDSDERIGNVLYSQGKPKESMNFYDKALQFDLANHGSSDLASDYGNLANALDDLGELDKAQKMQQQSLEAFEKAGDMKGVAETVYNLGNLALEMGNFDDARKFYEAAVTKAREIDYKASEPYPIEGLAEILAARGDSSGAAKQYEDALTLCKAMNNTGLETRIYFGQALLSLDDGNYALAEKQVRELLPQLDKVDTPGLSLAQAILARSLLAQGNLKAARDAASQSVELSLKTVPQTVRFDALLADARVKAKSAMYAEAHQELQTALAAAHKSGYRLYEYELRLALDEIEMDARVPDARAHLGALETDARSHGAFRLANQAKALAAGKSKPGRSER
jgi:eukaryotic-like serine/threonine-protein kinase